MKRPGSGALRREPGSHDLSEPAKPSRTAGGPGARVPGQAPRAPGKPGEARRTGQAAAKPGEAPRTRQVSPRSADDELAATPDAQRAQPVGPGERALVVGVPGDDVGVPARGHGAQFRA